MQMPSSMSPIFLLVRLSVYLFYAFIIFRCLSVLIFPYLKTISLLCTVFPCLTRAFSLVNLGSEHQELEKEELLVQ